MFVDMREKKGEGDRQRGRHRERQRERVGPWISKVFKSIFLECRTESKIKMQYLNIVFYYININIISISSLTNYLLPLTEIINAGI